jgi:hypothetical protein
MVNLIMPQLVTNPTGPVTGDHPYFARDCSAYGENDFYYPGSIVRFNPAIQVQCVNGLGTSLVRSDRTNFAPRLGVSWNPSAKWTIRAGGGVFYVQDQGNSFWDTTRNLAGPQISVNANTAIHDLTFENALGSGSAACGPLNPPYICVSTPVPFGNDPHRRTPYVVQYEANVQRELGNSIVLEIGYLGSQGNRLQALMNFDNSVPSAVGTIPSRTSFPEFNKFQNIMGLAESNYNSGTVKLTRRFAQGVTFLASYTLSKSLDDRSGTNPENGAETLRTPQIGYCITCEYGRSDFDSRQRFVVSALYELPIGRGKQWLNHGVASTVLGGWQLNSIVSKSSGFPVDIILGINQSNTLNNADRPNAVPGATRKLDNPTPAEWFNIQAFQEQPFGNYGNVGRNTVTSPGILDWDFSAFKNFNFTERAYLQFRLECFNCANHPNFGDPGQTLAQNRVDSSGNPIPGTGTFGRITSTRPGIDMRELQFSLKFIF